MPALTDHTHECRDCGGEITADDASCLIDATTGDCDWPGGNTGCTSEACNPTCLDAHVVTECYGPVEYRMPLSGTGTSFPRCEGHWNARLDRQEQINERYPDSPHPPADFDPTYAGEHWNDDY